MKKILLSVLACFAATLIVRAQDAKPAEAAPAAKEEAAPAGEVTKLMLGVIPAVMQYDKKELEVKAGASVMLLFKNEKCPLQHNFLLIKPGKLNDVGALADKMLTDPNALKKAYIPDSPEIIAHTKGLVGLGQSEILKFTAPTEPGEYPYLCTFPGHWRLMHGVLKVTK